MSTWSIQGYLGLKVSVLYYLEMGEKAHSTQQISVVKNTTNMPVKNRPRSNNEKGLRFNDPKLNIKWDLKITNISVKDGNWPLLQ